MLSLHCSECCTRGISNPQRQLEQNNRLGVVCGGVGGSRVSSLDASKSRCETIKLTPDLRYSLWPDMIILFLVLVGGANNESPQKIPTHLPIQPFTHEHQIAEERVPDKRFSGRRQRTNERRKMVFFRTLSKTGHTSPSPLGTFRTLFVNSRRKSRFLKAKNTHFGTFRTPLI